jgi:hypothetical protein
LLEEPGSSGAGDRETVRSAATAVRAAERVAQARSIEQAAS